MGSGQSSFRSCHLTARPGPWVSHHLLDNGLAIFLPPSFLHRGSKPGAGAEDTPLFHCPHVPQSLTLSTHVLPLHASRPGRDPPGPPLAKLYIQVRASLAQPASDRRESAGPPAGEGKQHSQRARPSHCVPPGKPLPSLGFCVPTCTGYIRPKAPASQTF